MSTPITTLPAIPLQPTAVSSLRVGYRLVPASIGRPGNVQTVYIQCPTWCHVDHAEVREVAVEDITHYGPGAFVQVPDMNDDDTAAFEWYVNVTSDPSASDPRLREAHLAVSDGASALDANLTDEQAEQLAGELERFAAEVRRALQVVRAANRGVDV